MTDLTTMAKTYHLAVDLGATSGRTILAAFDGSKVEMEELTRFKYPMLPFNGHLFWNLPLLYQEILNGIKKSKEVLGEKDAQATLTSIGIDSWGCDVAFLCRRLSGRSALLLPRQPHRRRCRAFLRENAARKSI